MNVRFEFDRETEVTQDLLKLLLLAVTAIDGIGHRLDNLPMLADVSPERGIIEMTAIGLAHGVVEVLHVGEYRDLLHRFSSWRRGAVAGLRTPGPFRRPVCQPGGGAGMCAQTKLSSPSKKPPSSLP
ncbi:hypothetical protein D3C72_1487680 [compost metagenome]